MDRVSELPQELQIRIISLLEMRDAVKTGILSKRWKYIWTEICNVVFKYHFPKVSSPTYHIPEWKISTMRKFIPFIDHTLMQCTRPTIEMFKLTGYSGLSHEIGFPVENLMEKWLKYVLSKNVKFLTLESMGEFYSVPNCLFQSSSIVKLEIEELDINKVSRVNWSSLKSLSLTRLLVGDECMDNILLGCPVLEILVLNDIFGVKNLNIMSKSIKKLRLSDVGWQHIDETLKIRAPWLKELEISGYNFFTQFQLVDVSSLENVAASLMFDYYPECVYKSDHSGLHNMVRGLRSLCDVGELMIESNIIQILSFLKLSGTPSPFFKCKRMTVKSPLWKYDLPGIAYLLENTPDLETLTIEVSTLQALDFPLKEIHEQLSNGNPHLSMPNGKLMHLKNVNIDYGRSSCNESRVANDQPVFFNIDQAVDFDLDLIEYIVKSTSTLEKLVIFSSRTYCSHCKTNCKFQNVPRLSSQLKATFPAEWEVRQTKSAYEFSFVNVTSLFPEK